MALRWVRASDGRYYKARIQRDLFDGLEVFCTWGSLTSKRGGEIAYPCQNLAAARDTLRGIAGRRRQHGYRFSPGRDHR